MMDRLEWWGDRLGVEVAVRHGDTTRYEREQAGRRPAGRADHDTGEPPSDLLTGSKMRVALEDVAHVVIDEVHELASAKRGAQLTVGLERLRRVAGPFQRIGLSATVGTPRRSGSSSSGAASATPTIPATGSSEIVEVAAGTRPTCACSTRRLRTATRPSPGSWRSTRQPRVTSDDPRDRRRPRVDADLRQHAADSRGTRLAVQDARGAGGEGGKYRRSH